MTGPELSDRELEVLQLIGQGMSNQEISTALTISESTVKTHVNRILSKLDVKDRTQAAIMALKRGIANL
jgi:two-component system NarL family response regulator